MNENKSAPPASTESESRKHRGPGVPTIALPKALSLMRKFWEKEKRNPAPVPAVVSHWGFSPKSSGGFLTVASMKRYDLLTDEGAATKRMLRLSGLALELLRTETSDPVEYQRLLKVAALNPAMHRELWEQYKHELPSDETLKSNLVFQRHFSEESAKAFIDEYKETISFSKLAEGDSVEDINPARAEHNDSQKPLFQQKLVTESIKRGTAPGTVLGDFLNPPPSSLREFNFPLPGGVASLKVPFPLTEQDYEGLLKTLATFKDGLVKKPEIPGVSCTQPNWEENAKTLAEMGEEFNLVNFSYSHDIGQAKELAKLHGFDLRLDINNGAALFRKRQQKT